MMHKLYTQTEVSFESLNLYEVQVWRRHPLDLYNIRFTV